MNKWWSFVDKLRYDVIEFLEIDTFVGSSLLVDVSGMQHLQNVIVGKVFPEVSGNILELLKVNGSVLVLVEKTKNSSKSVSGSCFSNSWSNNIYKLVESNCFVLVSKTV